MKNKKISWEKTRNLYVNWLSKTSLRNYFSKNILFENLSLWWLTNLLEKDNLNEPSWFKDLHKKLNKEKIYSKNSYFFLFFYKVLKKFVFHIISYSFIKIFYRNKFDSNLTKENCIHATYKNLKDYGKSFVVDRQYGLYGLKEKKKQIYFIEFFADLNSIKNFWSIKKKLNKIPFEYCISEKFVTLKEIIKIYYFTFKQLNILIKILDKKNFFIIEGRDCEIILKKKLLFSFFGPIQEQLIRGLCLKNFLKISNNKNFITCFDFHPGARVLYHFAKQSKVNNVININHANYSENNIFFNFNISDFSNENKQGSLYSPKPDYYFCQGSKYHKKIKKIFKNKTSQIGSLKNELEKPLNFKKIKKINFKDIFDNEKKILLILCSLHDYGPFIKLLNKCELTNFNILVLPHPLKKRQTISDFKKTFKKDFIEGSRFDKAMLLKTSDYIVFGDTSLGLELSILNKNIFRLYDSQFIPTFDLDKEIPTAINKSGVENFLKQKKIRQKSKLIEKFYFHKYDRKGSERLRRLLSRI